VLVTFQHYHVTQRLVVHNSVGNKTKSIRPRPKLQDQDQDQNYKTETGLVIRPPSQTPRLVLIGAGIWSQIWFTWHTYQKLAPEKMESIYGTGFWSRMRPYICVVKYLKALSTQVSVYGHSIVFTPRALRS